MFDIDFSRRIERGLHLHLSHVYSALASTTFMAVVGAYLDIINLFGSLSGVLRILCIIAQLVLLIYVLLSQPDMSTGDTLRLRYLNGFGFCCGMSAGPLIKGSMQIDPSLVATAVMYTSVIFTCFTLSTLLGREEGYLYLGGPLMSLLFCTLIMSLLNAFLRSPTLYFYQLVAGVLLESGFILYDTSLIMERHRNGSTDYVTHALILFVDIFHLFLDILRLLSAKRRSNDND